MAFFPFSTTIHHREERRGVEEKTGNLSIVIMTTGYGVLSSAYDWASVQGAVTAYSQTILGGYEKVDDDCDLFLRLKERCGKEWDGKLVLASHSVGVYRSLVTLKRLGKEAPFQTYVLSFGPSLVHFETRPVGHPFIMVYGEHDCFFTPASYCDSEETLLRVTAMGGNHGFWANDTGRNHTLDWMRRPTCTGVSLEWQVGVGKFLLESVVGLKERRGWKHKIQNIVGKTRGLEEERPRSLSSCCSRLLRY